MLPEHLDYFTPRHDSLADFEDFLDRVEADDGSSVLNTMGIMLDDEILAIAGTVKMEWGIEIFIVPSDVLETDSPHARPFIRVARSLVNAAVECYGTVFAHCTARTWEPWLELMGFELDTVFSVEGGCYLRYRRDK